MAGVKHSKSGCRPCHRDPARRRQRTCPGRGSHVEPDPPDRGQRGFTGRGEMRDVGVHPGHERRARGPHRLVGACANHAAPIAEIEAGGAVGKDGERRDRLRIAGLHHGRRNTGSAQWGPLPWPRRSRSAPALADRASRRPDRVWVSVETTYVSSWGSDLIIAPAARPAAERTSDRCRNLRNHVTAAASAIMRR